MNRQLLSIAFLVLLVGISGAQDKKYAPTGTSIWSVAVPPFTTLSSSATSVKAVLTPSQSIVVTRIEAFSERGPLLPSGSGNPRQCPTKFALQISNGGTTHVVPISNAFRKDSSAETYSDSGKLNLVFSADAPITLSLVVPEPGFPPAQCTCNGLNVAIQYQSVNPTR